MILYQLVCERHHTFEAWFRDSHAFDIQQAAQEVSCPACGTPKVSKALMAPNISSRKAAEEAPASESVSVPPAPPAVPGGNAGDSSQAVLMAKMGEMLRELRHHVEANCDNVGNEFAEEARKIHYGEADPRGIYGETTTEEARELLDEGIDFLAVPWLRRDA